MGGRSSSETNQNSTTNPWAPAVPQLTGMLSQLTTGLSNTGVTNTENGALNQLLLNGSNGNPYAGQIDNYASNLLNGGGATDQAGNVNSNYDRFVGQTNPLASNTDYNPMSTPGFSDAINTMKSDITNSVNGSFAAAGRDFSGMNGQSLGRGLMQGLAPTIANQYNQNVQNQQGAAGNLYNAGNTTSGLLTGLTQMKLGNQGQGVQAAGQALDAKNYGANTILQEEAARRGIPVQALGLLAQIGIPIAGLGGQSTGRSRTDQEMSGAQQFGLISGGVNKLFGAA